MEYSKMGFNNCVKMLGRRRKWSYGFSGQNIGQERLSEEFKPQI